MLTLDAKIIKLEAAIAAGGDPKALRPRLAVLMAAKAEMDDDDDDGPPKKKPDDGDGDEDSRAEKARAKADKAKREAEAAKHRAKAEEHRAKAEESEEAAKQCEDEGDDAKAAVPVPAPLAALTPGAAAALASQATAVPEALARIAKLEASAEARDLAATINDARAARRITPGEAKTLASKSGTFVREFLSMRPHALVATEEEALARPDKSPDADVPKNVRALTEQAIAAMSLSGKQADDFRAAAFADHRASAAHLSEVSH